MLDDGVAAVLFDAGFTLVEPVRRIDDVYLEEAEAVGAVVDAPRFRARFAETFLKRSTPDRGTPAASSVDPLATDEVRERGWWHHFTATLADDHPSLRERHREWLERLVARLDAPTAWRPLPDAERLLRRLRDHGVKTAVVTNWHSAIHGILEGLGLAPLLETVVASVDAGYKKPHRAIFAEALRRLGATAPETVHVGDSWDEDVVGARGAGLRPIYVARRPNVSSPDPSVPMIHGLGELADAFVRKSDCCGDATGGVDADGSTIRNGRR
ncbi:MAG: HAD family hydrolase [Planctomycetia bacterium]